MQKIHLKLLTVLLLLNLTGCGYNNFQTLDEESKASWSEVLNQYQRRADLVPNLVNIVKGYASHEKEVLTQVALVHPDCRSSVSQRSLFPHRREAAHRPHLGHAQHPGA